ncbi:hypothetical protein A33K_13547 [Burkholderia humptydooensis MSMB43]|uniref:Uncharacterized protein n=1 Tax=Burkholderia humptydooensis MSMB43 TaxID=441157 RepID=A0ABN0GD77_9BURK|nr:hypothetical protein A33K_13547 [Burkholderia humptydooensis MSMB43]
MPARLALGATAGFGRRRKGPQKRARAPFSFFAVQSTHGFLDGAAPSAASGGLTPMTSR